MGHKKRNLAPRSKPSVSSAAAVAVSPSSAMAAAGAAVAADGGFVAAEQQETLVLLNPSNIKGEAASLLGTESENVNNALASSAVVLSSYTNVKAECERALTALHRGNHTKALRLMKEMSSKYENYPYSALVHRVQGTVCVKVATIIDDPNAKQRHLRNAIDSARKAVNLSPNSIEFAHFYANLLYGVVWLKLIGEESSYEQRQEID